MDSSTDFGIYLIAQEGGGLFGNPNIMFAMIFAMIVMMYMSSRGEKKKRLAHQEWLNGLKKNVRVITKAGIHGTITSVRDDSIVIKIDDDKGIKMTITKDSISHAVPEKNEETK